MPLGRILPRTNTLLCCMNLGSKQHLQVLLLGCICLVAVPACLAQFDYIVGPRSWSEVVHSSHGGSSLDSSAPEVLQQLSRAARNHKQSLTRASTSRNYTIPYNICVSPWEPMVMCDTAEDADQTTFTGYQVELFRMLAQEVGWEDTDYYFTCMLYSDMLEDLKNPNGSCSLSAAGIEVSIENLQSNLKFSWPTYKSGLRVMISAHLQSGSTWAFSEVFHWTVWLALFGTAIAVGLLVALIEWLTPSKEGEEKKGWQAWSWYSMAKLVHVLSHVGDPTADASRILMLGYGFLVLVMVSMYTATSASRITAEKLVHPVHGKKDLAEVYGHKVETWDRYTDSLKKHHKIAADGRPWESDADKQAMIKDLRDGVYDAMVLDSPVLEYTVGTNEACDLFTVGEPFETFSLAIAFPADFDDDLVFGFSSSIVKLQTYQGALDMLENVYVKTGGTSKCFSSDSGHGSGKMIQLYQVSGLWYILLITIALCFFLTLLHNARKDPKSKVGKALRRVGILKEPPETSPSMANSTGEAVLGSMPGGMNHSFTSVMSSMPGHSGQGAAIDGKRTLKMFLGVQTFAYKSETGAGGEI